MSVAAIEDVVRVAMTPDLGPGAQQAWLDDAAACFERHGMLIVEDAIPREAISAVLEDFKVRHDVHMDPGQKKLFRTYQSDPLRAQVPFAIDGPVARPEVFAPPSVLPLMRRLMGENLIIGEMGVVISHAGAGPQETHRDGSFIFGGIDKEIDLPPFAINMLTPLLDVSLDMGPTEYWPGSHRIRDTAAATAAPPLRKALSAGSVLLMDSRTCHRGGANLSGPVRPSLYFSYHRAWYLEQNGYEQKPQVRVTPLMLHRLPEAYRSLFAWALHLNRTDGVQEFAYRHLGRIRKALLRRRTR